MQRTEDGVNWAAEPLHMRYTFRVGVIRMLPAQAIVLNKIPNILTLIIRREASFAGTLQSLLSYALAIAKSYGILFVDVRILDIVEIMTASIFLGASSRPSYIPYIRVGKIMIEYQAVLPLLTKPAKDTPAAKALGITHLDDASLFIYSEEDFLIIV